MFSGPVLHIQLCLVAFRMLIKLLKRTRIKNGMLLNLISLGGEMRSRDTLDKPADDDLLRYFIDWARFTIMCLEKIQQAFMRKNRQTTFSRALFRADYE